MDVLEPLIATTNMLHIPDEISNTKSPNKICDEAVGLLMTYRCNLDCKYCYIHTKRNKDMTLGMAQSILEPFLKMNKGILDITFMGGETLLAIDAIKPLVEWVENGKWNRCYRFLGATNGTLLNNDLKKWLKQHSHTLTLGLSYDGLPSTQNNNRGADNIDIDFFIETWPKQPIQMTIDGESVKMMAYNIWDVTNTEGSVLEIQNISEKELIVDEYLLTKKFIRGDESRTTEGSGLGLSIAKNLTLAQGGNFEIKTDGDLFKAMVTFDL